jgi:anti-sigma-K factor RskA
MRKRRDPSAMKDDDDGPKLISLQDKHDADRLLQRAFEAGEMDAEELKRRRGRVYAAVTPRDLWKATGHRAGSRERADKADLWRSLRLQLAIVVFAAVIMMVVVLGTILNNQGGTAGTPIFPWEWGRAGESSSSTAP